MARSIIAGRLGSGDPAGFPHRSAARFRTLAARGEITLLSRVPIIAYRRAAGAPRDRAHVYYAAGGMYVCYRQRPARFTGPGEFAMKNRARCGKATAQAYPAIAVVKAQERYL